MRLIVESKSDLYPRVNVAQAWKNLTRKFFASVTTDELTKQKTENVNENMKGYSDPDMFIDYLERMRAWLSELGAPIEDKPFVMDILSKLPGKYDVIIERINEILDEDEICKYDVLEMLQEKVRSRYDRMKREYNKKTPSYKKNEPEEDKAS